MADDPSSIDPRPRSWIDKIAQVFSDEPTDTKSLLEVLRNAEQDHVLDADALAIIEGALQVSSMQVREIMIPRPQVVTVSARDSLEEILDTVVTVSHSRFPVVAENMDSIIGILLAKDLLRFVISKNQEPFDVRQVVRPATFVPESKRLNVLLNEFRENRQHMAIVIDEYGSPCGIVTIEDVLEQIVGDIEDEHDFDDEEYIKALPSGDFLVKGLTPIEEFNEEFSTGFSDEEFDTFGGLVMNAFGHLPKRNEIVELDGFRVRILNADSRRIHLLRVSLIQP